MKFDVSLRFDELIFKNVRPLIRLFLENF